LDTVFNLFINGLQNILNLYTLSIGIAGAVMGVIVGALPGLGPSAGIALLLPITLKMNSDVALLMVISLYVGASFGGRISSILTNIPGDAASVATTFDGYPMTLKGQAGVALSLSAVASFIGGLIGVVIAVSFGNSISKYALMFGPPEYFAVMLLALGAISLLAGKNRVKTIVMTMLGLLLSMVGLDYVSGQNRLTFGSVHLEMGLDFLVMVMGVFAIGEILMQIYKGTKIEFKQEKFKINELLPEKKVWKRVSIPILRSSLLGFIVGVLPGAGATSATFLAYAVAKKMSRHPEEFGKGAPEGVSSVECANNSAAVGALIPMLTLGVPGSGTTAIILGALIMWGVRPGPLLIIECPQMYWGLFAGLFHKQSNVGSYYNVGYRYSRVLF
jgi:putative tricarboxylic transport membrane protein